MKDSHLEIMDLSALLLWSGLIALLAFREQSPSAASGLCAAGVFAVTCARIWLVFQIQRKKKKIAESQAVLKL